jgi:hypothetical protein
VEVLLPPRSTKSTTRLVEEGVGGAAMWPNPNVIGQEMTEAEHKQFKETVNAQQIIKVLLLGTNILAKILCRQGFDY